MAASSSTIRITARAAAAGPGPRLGLAEAEADAEAVMRASSMLPHGSRMSKGFGKVIACALRAGGRFGGRLRPDRQEHPEQRPFDRVVVDLDPAVVVLDDALGHRQPQAGPLTGVLGVEEKNGRAS